MPPIQCDVAIIGAGTAGLAAERSAREAGATTLLIDPQFRGTTCAAVGCMPSKLLIAAADAAQAVRDAATFGVHATPAIDGPAVLARVRRMRDDFVAATLKGMEDIPPERLLRATARFTGPTRLITDTGAEIQARSVIIATGAVSATPKAFAAVKDHILTNETVFEIDDLPASLAVVGAGPVGIELAQAFARLGVNVALFDSSGSLAGLDEEDSDRLADILDSEMAIHRKVDLSARRQDGAAVLKWDGREQTFDKILMAAGRPPALEGLDLEAAGLELDDHGVPVFDAETMQCGTAPVFVAGDANHDRPILHEATREGELAGRNAARYPDVKSEPRPVSLAVTFTQPNVAQVGTAPEGRALVGLADYGDQGRAKIEGEAYGFARIVADTQGRLCAATLCMSDGEHIAQFLSLAIAAKMTARDLLDHPLYHPTLEEGLRGALSDIAKALDQNA
ncbi:dihydrolipoyl dehydrogenase [Falsirhodobacter halotolerans]|uniref:dihydrolipoyl dehydrogenase n=1 Tax=Falsirhodobacter halotolerans TaxID=1146892 RepID=UPI001FD2B7B4|nr:dihydrolipoyl dehydrogenase [Falsirhodobacter halotolerans]MCJ8139992.1 dihydrolipoyl dehydrogenase [Falsirhodobacter halotolerans]